MLFRSRDRNENNIIGDRAEVFYTNLIRKYPFPEVPGEKFIPEGAIWLAICCEENLILRWINEKIYYCEYLDDGYSAKSRQLMLENPVGTLFAIKKMVKYLPISYFEKLKLLHRYFIVGKELNYSSGKIKNDLEISWADFFAVKIGKLILTILRGESNEN